LRELEIECEESAAHLNGCCPDLHLDVIDCRYDYDTGCGGPPGTHCPPALSLAESRLVQALGCDGIRSMGLCDLAVLHGPQGSDRARCMAQHGGGVDAAIAGSPDVATVPDDLRME